MDVTLRFLLLVQEQHVPATGVKEFCSQLKKVGKVPDPHPEMKSRCPFRALLLSINSFLSRSSISFVLEILNSYGIYSKSHYLAAARFLA